MQASNNPSQTHALRLVVDENWCTAKDARKLYPALSHLPCGELGYRLRRASRRAGVPVCRVPDAQLGEVYVYQVDIVAAVAMGGVA